jgi:hypothetical protein
MLLEDEDFLAEYVLAAEMADVEALEPRSLAEAMCCPDRPMWEAGIKEEWATLKAAGTWELVDKLDGVNVVGSKWVFRARKDAAGKIVRYKARLVAQRFSQVPRVDYFDTYAPAAKLTSIHAVLAMAAALDLELHQIDFKGAYLNGELTDDEHIDMRQPLEYPDAESPSKVSHLLKPSTA